ncbi:hypothetical protein LX95_02872 [Mesonia algae]|uniref:Uncharacterized protein n=1 Tax=Mesonia algae TaxID=213248 RepID=A0A2W7HTS6_9FLAO|nr:hypothetical protein LX95_02872 [Mesonia algae]
MELTSKIGQILFIIVLIYLWNKFIVKLIIGKVVNFHKKNNAKNLNKQPIKFFVENELKIIKIARLIYWFGGIIIIFGIIKE